MDLWTVGKNPISSEQPAGSDMTYEPEYEELQTALNTLSSRDWDKVVQLASEILTTKSKDLWAASALGVALIHTHRAEGLAIGLRVYRDLLTDFWNDLYPPKARMRKRIRTIEWWVEKTGAALKSLESFSLPPEQIKGVKEDLGGIDRLLGEYLEQTPSTASIREFLEVIGPEADTEEQAEPAEPPETRAEPVPEKTEPVETQKPPPEKEEAPGGMASLQDAQRELRHGLQKLRKVATYLWEADRTNPLVYRLNRTAWLQVAELPPAADGRTRLPPPDGQARKVLADCRGKGDWEGLLGAAEPMVGRFLLWLDLNRYVIEAMGHLGSPYEAARDTVCEETASLIGRLPGLADLVFSDGTPFADSETQSWFQDMTRDQGYSGKTLSVSQAMSASLKDGEAAETEQEHALNLLKGGKLLEAIDRLEKRMHDASSRKQKMYWRLALAELLLHSKKSRLVVPHLEEILGDIDQYRLEEWDPPLTLKALKAVWFGLNAQKDQTAKGKATEALNRIARMDLKEAIRLEKGG